MEPNTAQMLARIEKLESRAQRAAGGASVLSSFAGPIVANEAAATALPAASVPDGMQVFILSHRSIWTSAPSSAVALKAHEIIARNGGGRLERTTYSDPEWRIGRDDWYINPATGNDEGPGTSLLPLQTGAEHARRIGTQNLVQQSGGSPNFSVNLHILGNIIAPDFIQVDCVLAGDTEFQVFGEAATTNATSVGPTALTAENQATNTPWSFTDAATAAALVVGRRIRWTAGVAIGAVAWVAKSLGASAFRISNTALSTATGFGIIPTNKTPAVNDDYVVETLTRVNLGIIRVCQQADSIGFGASVYFNDLQLESSAGTLHLVNDGALALNQVQIVFYQCKFMQEIESFACYFANCCFAATPVFRQSSYVYGGLAFGATTIVEWQSSNEGQIQNDMYVQGTLGIFVGGTCTIGNCGVFDSVAGGGGGTGDGVCVGLPGGITSNTGPGYLKIAGRLWGNGNAGVGLNIRSGCMATYATTPNITGSAPVPDFMLAGTTAAGYYFNAATGSYLPLGGQACTWALLAAAKGAPGYGGSAHEPDKDAHLNLFA